MIDRRRPREGKDSALGCAVGSPVRDPDQGRDRAECGFLSKIGQERFSQFQLGVIFGATYGRGAPSSQFQVDELSETSGVAFGQILISKTQSDSFIHCHEAARVG